MPQSLRDRRPQWIVSTLLVSLLCLTLGSLWSYRSAMSEMSLFSAELFRREAAASTELQELSRRYVQLTRQKEKYETLIVQWRASNTLIDLVPSLSQIFGDHVTLHHLKSEGENVSLSVRSSTERSVSEFLERLRHIKGFYFDRSVRRDPAARSGSVYIITGRRSTP